MRSRIVGLSLVLTAGVNGGLLSTDTAAQSTKPPARIGWLTPDRRPTTLAGFATAFHQALAALGHVEHRSYVMEYRFADSDVSKYPALVAELVRLPVDVIVTTTTPATRAAKAVTPTVPIVFKLSADPVERGLVASLARPGGNLTGFFLGTYDDKGLEALKECVPKLSRVGWLSTDSSSERTKAAEISQHVGVKIMYLPVDGPPDLAQALAAAAGGGLDGLYVVDLGWMRDAQTKQIADFAVAQRLPAIGPDRSYADAGTLLSFGPKDGQSNARAAALVDKILKGAKPADLPVEQPTLFELVVNLKTAKAIGITLRPGCLHRVDAAIQ